MKKIVLLSCFFVFGMVAVVAQTLNSSELAKLKLFLAQGSAVEGKKNYEQLEVVNLESVDWKSIPGLVWNANGRLDSVTWNNKNLGGNLDLGGFEGLRFVRCEYNELQTFNVTGNTNLLYVDCFNNKLNAIDLTTNVNLASFCCRYNADLKELDLTHNTKLTYFCGSGNKFEQMDLSKNPDLEYFFCAANRLKSLDVSKNPKLKKVYLRGNQLTELDFSNHKELTVLTCWENQLKTLNVSGCAKLEELPCHTNQLKTLNASDSPNLKILACQGNQLEELKVNSSKLETLRCESNRLNTLDLSESSNLESLYCYENQLREVKISSSKIQRLQCEDNKFAFSTLPRLKSYMEYTYTPQAKVEITAPSNKVNLNSEYKVDDALSKFTWIDAGGAEITPVNNQNGVFSFDKSYIGKALTCKVTNSKYPDLEMEYAIALTTPSSVIHPDQDIAVYAKENRLFIKTDKPVKAQVYTITGALKQQFDLGEGETMHSLSSGLYIVKLSNGFVRKIIIR